MHFILSKLNRFFCLFVLICCPCHGGLPSDTLFLTWQKDPTTTMTIQWLSVPDQEDDHVEYHAEGEFEWRQAKGVHFPFPLVSTYVFHRTELTNLLPDTLYRFKIADSSQEYLFRTMPAYLSKPIHFVVGGDMYHDEIDIMTTTSKQAAKKNPHFAVLGGDIAYAVKSRFNSNQSVQKWLEWVKAWHQTMVTEAERLIPVVSAIGNHDIVGHYNQTAEQAKGFFCLFPMPGTQGYNVLDLGNYLSLFILDSGHSNPIGGAQTHWLKNALESRSKIPHKLAVYHVPAYPSVRPFHTVQCTAIRHHWVPLFEAAGMQMAFEHHDHAYKRTYPLIKNKVQTNGTVYIGDGAWGVEKPRTHRSDKKPFYLAKFAPVRHFLFVTLGEKEQQVLSINDQGHVIDEYIRPLP